MKNIICDSGIMGYQCFLRESYNDLDEFIAYSEINGLAERLGYDTPEEAWEDNPLIQGSTIPSDFRVS